MKNVVCIDLATERFMQVSIFLARLLGPLLLLPGIGLLVNPRAFRAMATEVVGSITLVYLFGLFDFAAGLAIVLVHNVWTVNWRVLITLIGWLLLIRGAARILITDTLMDYAKTVIRKKQLYPVSGVVLVFLGLMLCYFGYVT
jgi:uncharacterized protein YjeT (DUF2065 family)